MIHRFAIVPVAGALLLLAGCATKGFVRNELKKSETGIEQKLGGLETDLSQEKERVSGALAQISGVRSLAGEASARGDQAITKADSASSKADQASGIAGQALAKANDTDSRLSRLWANRHNRTLVETVVVNFGFDKWELDDRAETTLLDVVKQLKENPNLFVDLEGYTDSVGPTTYNAQLSQRRAEAIRRFLVEKGVELPRIHSIGLGPIKPVADNMTREGRAQNRRVVVKLFIPAE